MCIKRKRGERVFSIGDKVVYPVHGAGIIEGIEVKEILGEEKSYYILRIYLDNMCVMVPVDAAETIGMRSIIAPEEVKEVIEVFRSAEPGLMENWNKRYRANMEKIKSGDICQVAEVVRGLMRRHISGSLSSGERRMLDYARKILVSELMLTNDEDEDQTNSLLEKALTASPGQQA